MVIKPFCCTEIEFLSMNEMKSKLISIKNLNLVLLLTEASAKRWRLHEIISKLMSQNDTVWFDEIKPNPTLKDIYRVLEEIQLQKIDLIIAFGGGSTIDLAKGISAFYRYKNPKYTLINFIDCIKSKS